MGKFNTNALYHVGGNGLLFADVSTENSFAGLHQIVN